ncbi:hypothetical protein O3M35_005661 [Rhynocoris fuscipes]|uniref:Uncharacterized protein n=1 Tax=Rhynocoris fuscipes TaxID=488301 RepID=A0AAW1DPX1_9HEMI
MLYHVIISYVKLKKQKTIILINKNLMWPTHDFLVHLFNYKIFVVSSCQIRTL